MTEAEHEAMLDGEIVGVVRDVTKDITGGNCAFADDDVRLLGRLALKAIKAGLFYDEKRSTWLNIEKRYEIGRFSAQAIEAQRAETAQTGSAADESAVAESDAPEGEQS